MPKGIALVMALRFGPAEWAGHTIYDLVKTTDAEGALSFRQLPLGLPVSDVVAQQATGASPSRPYRADDAHC